MSASGCISFYCNHVRPHWKHFLQSIKQGKNYVVQGTAVFLEALENLLTLSLLEFMNYESGSKRHGVNTYIFVFSHFCFWICCHQLVAGASEKKL